MTEGIIYARQVLPVASSKILINYWFGSVFARKLIPMVSTMLITISLVLFNFNFLINAKT